MSEKDSRLFHQTDETIFREIFARTNAFVTRRDDIIADSTFFEQVHRDFLERMPKDDISSLSTLILLETNL